MRFLLLILFLMASVAGFHFLEIDLLNEFSEKEISQKKIRAIKPKFLREKITKVPTTFVKPIYSFFETLNDPTMVRYVGLNGKLLPVSPSFIRKEVSVSSETNSATIKKTEKLKISEETGQRPDPKRKNINENEGKRRYAVQVSSFRNEERAGALKMRLQKKGFDAFLMRTELANNGGIWHRVFLGRYADGGKAQEAARLARSQYKLNAVVVSKY